MKPNWVLELEKRAELAKRHIGQQLKVLPDAETRKGSIEKQAVIDRGEKRERKREEGKVAWGWAGKQYISNMSINYKLTTMELDRLWGVQEGKCAGCEAEMAHPTRREMKFGLKPEIDHDHVTGEVRGLLCKECNRLLGTVQDRKEQLRNLYNYLERCAK